MHSTRGVAFRTHTVGIFGPGVRFLLRPNMHVIIRFITCMLICR
jgi:hypothetical protein